MGISQGCLAKTKPTFEGCYPVHFTISVLISSTAVLEPSCTDRNSKENTCSRMSPHTGTQKQPKLLQKELSEHDGVTETQTMMGLKVTMIHLEKRAERQEFLHPSNHYPCGLPVLAAPRSDPWLEAGMRRGAKWQLQQLSHVYWCLWRSAWLPGDK